MNRTINFASGLIILWITGYLLIAGSNLIIPFIIALFVWNLLNTANNAIQRLPWIGIIIPQWLSMIISLGLFVIFVQILINIIANNVNEVIAASSRYQENFMKIIAHVDNSFQLELIDKVKTFVQNLSFQRVLVNIAGMFTSITSSAVLIALYVVFLFIEQHFFQRKIKAIFAQPKSQQLVHNIFEHIARDTQTYIGLKTFVSLATAFFSYLIMKGVGLDFAEFWALLIFFLNFIPNIGAIIATVFPAALALIQFSTWSPFIILTSGIIFLQFFIGNIIEPKLMGRSLNLSPLVILLALGVWGSIWGILGMFLSVPITVILMIIFAHFESTKPIAILLSQDGCIQRANEQLESKKQ
jgi:predicted PurR-regulated permease PerM